MLGLVLGQRGLVEQRTDALTGSTPTGQLFQNLVVVARHGFRQSFSNSFRQIHAIGFDCLDQFFLNRLVQAQLVPGDFRPLLVVQQLLGRFQTATGQGRFGELGIELFGSHLTNRFAGSLSGSNRTGYCCPVHSGAFGFLDVVDGIASQLFIQYHFSRSITHLVDLEATATMSSDLNRFQNADMVALDGIAQQHLVLHGLVTADQGSIFSTELSDDVIALGTQLTGIAVRHSNHVFRSQLGQDGDTAAEGRQVVTTSHMQTAGAVHTAVGVHQLLVHEDVGADTLTHATGVNVHEHTRFAGGVQSLVDQYRAVISDRQLTFLHEGQQILNRVGTVDGSHTAEEVGQTFDTAHLGYNSLELRCQLFHARDDGAVFQHSDHGVFAGFRLQRSSVFHFSDGCSVGQDLGHCSLATGQRTLLFSSFHWFSTGNLADCQRFYRNSVFGEAIQNGVHLLLHCFEEANEAIHAFLCLVEVVGKFQFFIWNIRELLTFQIRNNTVDQSTNPRIALSDYDGATVLFVEGQVLDIHYGSNDASNFGHSNLLFEELINKLTSNYLLLRTRGRTG